MFVDDGLEGAFSEVNSENDASVRNNPGLHELVITSTFDSASVGRLFRVKVLSYNVEGETFSDTASITLGDVPDAPLTTVRKVQELSSTNSIAIEFDQIIETNGLPILSYSLEIDYDLSGNFVAVIGLKVP